MRLALLTETFSKKMGYLPNALPKYLSRLGIDVHVITMNLPPYYQINRFKETYGGFSDAEELIPGSVERNEEFTLHVLPFKRSLGYMRMVGLLEKLRSIGPDVVQTLTAIGWIPQDAALFRLMLGYKLFTGSHTTASVFPLANNHIPRFAPSRIKCFVTRTIPGYLVSLGSEKCYAATSDCSDVALRFFGVQSGKLDVCPLGVDTDFFSPVSTDEHREKRKALRAKLGFDESDIVCIYTGRFSADKNPLLLAIAIAQLRDMGHPFKGLFMGNGEQVGEIGATAHCVVQPFVPFQELGDYFRAAEIGVWPTQESMSMLDAAASGLPIVVNNTLKALERIEGNGITYKLNDLSDLINALKSLRDPEHRGRLGAYGASKMSTSYSWDAIARSRLRDYQAALAGQ